jgi:hypothetical protein
MSSHARYMLAPGATVFLIVSRSVNRVTAQQTSCLRFLRFFFMLRVRMIRFVPAIVDTISKFFGHHNVLVKIAHQVTPSAVPVTASSGSPAYRSCPHPKNADR